MATRVQALIDGTWENIPNVSDSGQASKALNGMGRFNFEIVEATTHQLSNITRGTPIRFVDQDLTIEGIARKVDGNNNLRVEGTDYSDLANNRLLRADDLNEIDTSLSSGFNVVYTGTEFREIVKDIAQAMGLTADNDSVDTFGSLNIRFKRTYGIEALKELAKQSGYEWIVDNNQKLFMKTRLGSTTPVTSLNLQGNASLIRKEEDEERRCTRAIVFGSGNTSGEAEDVTYIGAGEIYEGRFKFNALSTNAMCQQRAEEIVKEFKDPILILVLNTFTTGYDLGDTITLRGRSGTEDYRITKVTLKTNTQRELDVTNQDRKHRTETPDEIIEKLLKGGSQDVSVITSGDDIQDLTYTGTDVAGPSRDFVFDFYVDPEGVTDVLKADLFTSRIRAASLYGTETGNSFTGAGINNSSQNAGHGISNSSQNAGVGINNATAGSPSTGYERLNLFDSLFTGGWTAAGSATNISNNPHFFHVIFGIFQTTIDHGGGSSVFQTIRVRAYNTSTGEYYPNSGGIYALFEGYQGEGVTRYIIPFNLFIPRSWQNQSYRLEYNISSSLPGIFIQSLDYGYYGSRGHSHTNSTTGGNHTHFNSITGGTHTHSNSFSDSQHQNPLNIDLDEFDTIGSITAEVIVNGTSVGNITLSSFGSTNNIDISSYITSPGNQRIVIKPNNPVALSANANIKIFKS